MTVEWSTDIYDGIMSGVEFRSSENVKVVFESKGIVVPPGAIRLTCKSFFYTTQFDQALSS